MRPGWLAAGIALTAACREPEPTPAAPIAWPVPANLGAELPQPERNPITAEGVALGRALFFDPRLSGSGSLACATCHRPRLAHSDGLVRSTGASGEPLLRHTPALVNLAWMDGYFWDGGAHDLESQVFAPLFGRSEMNADADALLAWLAADPEYDAAFVGAFGRGPSLPLLARAIAQFERTLVSASSRYDCYVRGEDPTALSEHEQRGLRLFRRHCATCHVPDLFTDGGYHNTGLDAVFPEDHERLAWGRGRITHSRLDIGKFKTPTLRNVAITAPYMHDGRFATLQDVLDHYRRGLVRSTTLAPELTDPERSPAGIDDDGSAAIIAFLHALTDRELEP